MKRLVLIAVLLLVSFPARAEEKNWNGQGDQTTLEDGANWLPVGAPGASDDAMINFKDASVDISQTYHLKSLTLGGKRKSTLNVSNFTEGDVTPGHTTDEAVMNRRDGYLLLKGSAGKITLKGAYKDSEEVIPDEPSFMLYVK